MATPQQFMEQNRTGIFDWLVFITSVTLGFVYSDLGTFASSKEFPVLMLLALFLYTSGAWLKHLPLYFRMIRSGKSPRDISWLLFLLLGHWILMLFIIIFAIPAFIKVFHIHTPENFDESSPWIVFGSIIAATYITWMVYYHSKKFSKTYSATYLFYRELIADIFLFTSVSFFTFTFWEKGVMTMFANYSTASLFDLCLMFVFLCLAFMMVYLPFRYLYLVEDHTSNQTRKRLLLIFFMLLVRSIFFRH